MSFALGPIWGAVVVLVKNLIHMTSTRTAFVGELANFLVGAAFVIPAGIVYKKNRTKKGAILGLFVSTLSMTVIGYIVNLYITIPFYSRFMPMEEIINISSAANKFIKDLPTLVLFGITPFNLLKGAIISLITAVIYKPISPMLHRLVESKSHDLP
jgi:riboflavin transporter FmnP